MHIDPEIAALRSEQALQRSTTLRMEQARENWLSLPATKVVVADLQQYGTGKPLAELPALSGIVSGYTSAASFVDGFISIFTDGLQDKWLGKIPFSHSCQGGFSTLQLLSEGGASLALLAYDPIKQDAPIESAIFVDRELHEIVVTGSAVAKVHRLSCADPGEMRITSEQRCLKPGVTFTACDHHVTRQIVSVEQSLVVLQLTRTRDEPGPTREYHLADAQMIQQASGSKQVSQCEIALAVLGAMKRRDAVTTMAALACDGPAHLRWEAIRQTLALDPIAGMRLLAQVASSPDDHLQRMASNLMDQLTARYPQLSEEKVAPCPA